MRRRRRVLAIVAAVLLSWVAAGILRAGPVAGDAFARVHAGAAVADVVIGAQVPVPPLWAVTVSGDVIEAGGTSPVYRSTMILLVEPLTGWSATFAAG